MWVGSVDKQSPDYDIAKRFEKGPRVSLETLRQLYSGVVLAYGASKDRLLGLENEFTAGVYPSRRIVNWYNGSLDSDINDLGLAAVKDVVVVGNGNIFCDMARCLLKSPDELAKSDMPAHVVEQLRESKLTNLQSVARRGITHAAFTTKEIRELAAIPGLDLYMIKDEV